MLHIILTIWRLSPSLLQTYFINKTHKDASTAYFWIPMYIKNKTLVIE